ncbi:hypothetical protein Vadar_016993 [Vaccinium darrowii]|uniref:Uncharacterized protein n=1 Tax=Vaccinium darrowii TaxID=229202 RepID=A0ACB7ZK16_9ERIC|nr:hypothetical protein Vadar_016993 [Vaccinium darrowii]
MAIENFVQPAIPRFDGHYDYWSMLIENFLRSKEYWHLIEVGYIELAESSTLRDAQKVKLKEATTYSRPLIHEVVEQALQLQQSSSKLRRVSGVEKEEAAATTMITPDMTIELSTPKAKDGMIIMAVTRNKKHLINPKSNATDVTGSATTVLNVGQRCTREREQNQIPQRVKRKFLF